MNSDWLRLCVCVCCIFVCVFECSCSCSIFRGSFWAAPFISVVFETMTKIYTYCDCDNVHMSPVSIAISVNQHMKRSTFRQCVFISSSRFLLSSFVAVDETSKHLRCLITHQNCVCVCLWVCSCWIRERCLHFCLEKIWAWISLQNMYKSVWVNPKWKLRLFEVSTFCLQFMLSHEKQSPEI